MNVERLTKQGVRDLNGPAMNGTGYTGTPRRRRQLSKCPHVWDFFMMHDCMMDMRVPARRCGLCQEVRSGW